MLFVDHDPARLAGQVDERWRLAARHRDGDGRGSAGQRGSGGRAGAAARDQHTPRVTISAVTIAVTGLESGSLGKLARLPGVLGG